MPYSMCPLCGPLTHLNVGNQPRVPNMRFQITVDRDEDGTWIVECPAIPGCVSQGHSRAEALRNIKGAIWACLKVRAERGLRLFRLDDGKGN